MSVSGVAVGDIRSCLYEDVHSTPSALLKVVKKLMVHTSGFSDDSDRQHINCIFVRKMLYNQQACTSAQKLLIVRLCALRLWHFQVAHKLNVS